MKVVWTTKIKIIKKIVIEIGQAVKTEKIMKVSGISQLTKLIEVIGAEVPVKNVNTNIVEIVVMKTTTIAVLTVIVQEEITIEKTPAIGTRTQDETAVDHEIDRIAGIASKVVVIKSKHIKI